MSSTTQILQSIPVDPQTGAIAMSLAGIEKAAISIKQSQFQTA
jgi:hypothetical protein